MEQHTKNRDMKSGSINHIISIHKFDTIVKKIW